MVMADWAGPVPPDWQCMPLSWLSLHSMPERVFVLARHRDDELARVEHGLRRALRAAFDIDAVEHAARGDRVGGHLLGVAGGPVRPRLSVTFDACGPDADHGGDEARRRGPCQPVGRQRPRANRKFRRIGRLVFP